MSKPEQITLDLLGMTCTNCSNTIQRQLNKVEGVQEAAVNFASEKASVTYFPDLVGHDDLVAVVRRAGFDVIEAALGEDAEDAEAAARETDIRHQWKRLTVGVVFTLPLFLLSMARDFGFLGAWSHESWVNWFFFALATPVQFT